MPAHIVAFVLFEILQQKFPRWDVYKLLRLAAGEVIPWHRVNRVLAETLVELKRREASDEFRLSSFVAHHDTEEVLEEGVSYLRTYHAPELVERLMNGVLLNKLDLLYYYGNRVRSYDIDMDGVFARAQ
jgi:glycerol-3-phosphate O-acyltransferase